ncbi:oligosaccharide flippase family protein [Candidatus Micrarchaeota archaeon]|nr:oligosaccharide flippase family protein [Candidatus Micrarchaeota archaeon]
MLERVLKQNFFAVSSQAFVLVFGAAFTIAFAHLLSKEEFGLLSTFVALAMLAVNLSDVGVQQTAVRFFGRSFFAKDGKAGFYFWHLLKIKLAASLVVCALVLVFSSQLAEIVLHDASLVFVFQLIGMAAFVYTFVHYAGFLFSAVNKYEFVSLSSLCLNALKLAVPLAVVYFMGANAFNAIVGVSLSFVLALAVYFAIFLYLFNGKLEAKKQGDAKPVDDFLFYSAVTAFVGYLFSNSDILLINYFSNSEQVALYRAAQVILNAIFAAIPVSTTFLYSFFVEMEAKKRGDVQAKMFDRMLKYGAMFLIPLTFYLVFFAPEIMGIYPRGYAESVPALQFFALAIFFVFVQNVSTTMLYTKAMVKKITVLTLALSLLMIVFNIALIPKLGFLGASITYVVAYGAVSIASLVLASCLLKLKISSKHVVKPLAISLVVTVALSQLRANVNPFVLLAATPFAFAVAYLILLDEEDKQLMQRIIRFVRKKK